MGIKSTLFKRAISVREISENRKKFVRRMAHASARTVACWITRKRTQSKRDQPPIRAWASAGDVRTSRNSALSFPVRPRPKVPQSAKLHRRKTANLPNRCTEYSHYTDDLQGCLVPEFPPVWVGEGEESEGSPRQRPPRPRTIGRPSEPNGLADSLNQLPYPPSISDGLSAKQIQETIAVCEATHLKRNRTNK